MSQSELRAVFLSELEDLLLQMEQDILELERQEDTESTLQRLFRSAHTLKGSSAVMGFDVMVSLTHAMENVLDELRQQRLDPTPDLINALFQALDKLTIMKQELESSGHIASTGEEEIIRLEACGHLSARSQKTLIVTIAFDPACVMKAARAHIILQELMTFGQVLSTEPELDALCRDEELDHVAFLLRTNGNADDIVRHVLQFRDIRDCYVDIQDGQLSRRAPSSSEPVISGNGASPGRAESVNMIRIHVERLEQLMNLAGELVIDQTRLIEVNSRIRQRQNMDEAMDQLEQVTNHIVRIIGDLQETVMKSRMLPIEQLFNRFPRMVRDLSRQLHKNVDFLVTGQETELDRTVIEEITDPLIHLLRNAIDHGIEPEEVRVKSGKPARGTIKLQAYYQGSQVFIVIEDDGAGIDIRNVKRTAVEKGLVTEQEADAMSDQEALKLLFLPGFSTAKAVSDISGRGVGMDIVKNRIEKLNGIIDVQSAVGKGTTFTIKLPLTLAIIPGMLVKVNDWTCAIPLSGVMEILRVESRQIESVKGQQVIQVRDQILPLVRMQEVLQFPCHETSQHVYVVIIGLAEKRLGLVVDELIGNQDIVVKSLGSFIGKIDGISGATILGDGRVAMILDIAELFQLAGMQRQYSKQGGYS